MKSVSWEVAFRKLNEWQVKRSLVAVGEVGSLEIQGEATPIFKGESGYLSKADATTGDVSVDGHSVNLMGATFKFSDFEDSPFNEADLGPDEFESQLEATFPDGRVVVFARYWDV